MARFLRWSEQPDDVYAIFEWRNGGAGVQFDAALAPRVPSGATRARQTAATSPTPPTGSASPLETGAVLLLGISVPQNPTPAVDFAHVKKQLPIARVLEHLGLASKLRGPGAQKRCACPIHRADGRGQTFSVNLDQNVFHCFEAGCQKTGDVIDLWAAVHALSVRDAALDLVQTFDLEATPAAEKRHG